MMFVDDIVRIVQLGIASSYVENDEPVSVILLGNPEIGKSSILLGFNTFNGVHVFTDLTKTDLSKFYKEVSNRETKYIVIPDFLKVMSRGKAAKANILTMLNAGIEEGIRDLSLYYSGVPDTTDLRDNPIRFGIATAVTREVISDSRRGWNRIGFFSRLIPVSFSYTREQAKAIRHHIFSGGDLDAEKVNMRLRKTDIKCNRKYPMSFEDKIVSFADAQRLYGFRMSKQVRGLLKASALLRGSGRVGKKDCAVLEDLMRHINLDYNPVDGGG